MFRWTLFLGKSFFRCALYCFSKHYTEWMPIFGKKAYCILDHKGHHYDYHSAVSAAILARDYFNLQKSPMVSNIKWFSSAQQVPSAVSKCF